MIGNYYLTSRKNNLYISSGNNDGLVLVVRGSSILVLVCPTTSGATVVFT